LIIFHPATAPLAAAPEKTAPADNEQQLQQYNQNRNSNQENPTTSRPPVVCKIEKCP